MPQAANGPELNNQRIGVKSKITSRKHVLDLRLNDRTLVVYSVQWEY